MQATSVYIAYLLTQHECVIVPGLGAFVVSGSEESKNNRAGLLCPPKNFLGFNPDIRHNDGLLANTIAKGESISYKEACLQISLYVDRIISQMEEQTTVHMQWIGKLKFSTEGKILFTPSTCLSCNVITFGMDNFYMPSIHELNVQEEYPLQTDDQSFVDVFPKQSIIRRYLAIAAIIIALLMIAIPVNNHSMQQSQTAQIISLPTLTLTEAEVAQPEKESFEEPIRELIEELTQAPIEEPSGKITPYYYVVIASLPTQSSAQVQMAHIKKEGFSTADIVSVGNKHRIYVAKFCDRSEANSFLARFCTQHPKYHDAWLFIQRI